MERNNMSKMFTEAEFSAAMEKAVVRRGADWKFPTDRSTPGFYFDGTPTYADWQGNATCLIGAAMHELGMKLPMPGTMGSASMALERVVPWEVIVGARVAQIHQDFGKPWGEALAMYREGLRMAKHRDVLPFMVNDFYYTVAQKVLGINAPQNIQAELKAMVAATEKTIAAMNTLPTIKKPEYITGDWDAPSEMTWTWSGTSVILNVPTISPEVLATFSGAIYSPVLTKGAHALTA
jgi:hypothetical protein